MRMKRGILSLVTMVGVGLLTSVSVQAHHAFAAEFDANRPVKIEGTIVKVQWTNPHAWFHVDVKQPDGRVERWLVEAGGPGNLTRRGITRTSFPPGTEVVVEGYASKGPSQRMNGRSIADRSGRSLFMGSSGTGAPDDGRDLSETQKRGR